MCHARSGMVFVFSLGMKRLFVFSLLLLIALLLVVIGLRFFLWPSPYEQLSTPTPEGQQMEAAILDKDLKKVSALLAQGISVDVRMPRTTQFRPGKTLVHSMTPLMLASETGQPTLVRLFLERGADVSLHDNAGANTALHYAVFAQHAEIVQLLLEAGADPNAKRLLHDSTPLPVLWDALEGGQAEIVRALVQAGADPGVSVPGIVVGAPGALDLRSAAKIAGTEHLLP